MGIINSQLLPQPDTGIWTVKTPRPSSATLLDLGMGRGEVGPLLDLEQSEQRMREAVAALAACRPGGATWQQAERDDWVAVEAGKPASAVAELLTSDVERWGECLALVNVYAGKAQRFADSAGAEVKRRAGNAAQVRIIALTQEVEEIVVPVWPRRDDRAAAWHARNACDALCRQLAVVSAVAMWSAGHGYNDSHKLVNPRGKAGGYAAALRAELDGVTLLTLDNRLTYPDDLNSEAKEMRAAPMLIGNRMVGPVEAARRG